MRLTTKARYAVTAMLDIALTEDNRPVTLADISERQEISISYLEQIFSKLRKNGLVNSVKGPGGGYKLSQSADNLSIADIIAAVNENIDATGCNGKADCKQGKRCMTHNLWQDLSNQIQSFLSDITLQELVDRKDVREVAELIEDDVDMTRLQAAN